MIERGITLTVVVKRMRLGVVSLVESARSLSEMKINRCPVGTATLYEYRFSIFREYITRIAFLLHGCRPMSGRT